MNSVFTKFAILLLVCLSCASAFGKSEELISYKDWKSNFLKLDPGLSELFSTETKYGYFVIYKKSSDVVTICYHPKDQDQMSSGTIYSVFSADRQNKISSIPNTTKGFATLTIKLAKKDGTYEFPDGYSYRIQNPKKPITIHIKVPRYKSTTKILITLQNQKVVSSKVSVGSL